MALQKCGLNVNRVSQELQPHGTLDFPCAGYASYYTNNETDVIPWHWHEEMEIIYIEEGQLNLKIPSASFCVGKGDCAAVNSNILHYGRALESCQLRSLVFSPKLIMGYDDSAFAKKYLLPLISCSSFSGCLIETGDDHTAAGLFQSAFKALEYNSFGYEFTVRDNLSRICLMLYQQFEQDIAANEIAPSQDNLRIRAMLEYIHKHYSDNITLGDIASSADIGERECLRCFQKTIQLSPIQYLLKYRIIQGADLLLKNPSDSVSEIAALCGFDSSSNFSKMFKRFYNHTPRDYRNSNNTSSKSLFGT